MRLPGVGSGEDVILQQTSTRPLNIFHYGTWLFSAPGAVSRQTRDVESTTEVTAATMSLREQSPS
jgi:hypothetical protein